MVAHSSCGPQGEGLQLLSLDLDREEFLKLLVELYKVHPDVVEEAFQSLGIETKGERA